MRIARHPALPPATQLAAALAVLVLAAAPAAAQPYNAVSSFSISNGNPNGVWSYLGSSSYALPDNGLATLTSTNTQVVGSASAVGWSNAQQYPNYRGVSHYTGSGSTTSGTVGFDATLLDLDPQGGVAAVRFIAPTAGVYSLSGLFEGLDTQHGSHTTIASIYDNGVLIPTAQYTVGAYQSTNTFNFAALALTAGEMVDFTVISSDPNDGTYRTTGLAAEFDMVGASATTTPEPASFALLGVGLAGIAAAARRRRA